MKSAEFIRESVYYLGHPLTRYFEGDCPIFAVALHRITGYPIYGLVEDGNLVHAYVKDLHGNAIDASGNDTDVETMLAEFPNEGQAQEVQLSEQQVLSLGYGKKQPPNVNKIIPIAQEVLDELL